MQKALTSIDISNKPDLLRLAEEVRHTKTPQVLKKDEETVAVLMPLGTTLKRYPPDTQADIWADYNPQQVQVALAASAGTLAGVDRERLLADIHNARSQEHTNRPV